MKDTNPLACINTVGRATKGTVTDYLFAVTLMLIAQALLPSDFFSKNIIQAQGHGQPMTIDRIANQCHMPLNFEVEVKMATHRN